MSSTTKQIVFQLKEDLLKARQRKKNNDSPGHDSDERILDILNRLDELNIDIGILVETKIGKTVAEFKKKYSEDISIKASSLKRKWVRIYKDANSATPTNQNNYVGGTRESSNSNDMEGSNKRTDDDDDDNRDTSNEDFNDNREGNYKSDDGNNRVTNNEDGKDNTSNGQQHTQAGNADTKMSCDICSKPANFRRDIGQLQRCKHCGIYVHELCYCMVPTTELDPNFTCHACKAVGTTVEVNVPSKLGGTNEDKGKTREQMTVEERPMECMLCLHSSGCHAMHPLYDTCGNEGRQYVLKATRSGIGGKPRRLAWVHTLCAQMLARTKGYLYGVDYDGEYEDDNRETARDSTYDDIGIENGKRRVLVQATEGGESDSDEEVGGQRYKIGTKIYKEFSDGFYKGRVDRFDKKHKLYKIIYTDGDYEDMTESDVEGHLQKPPDAAPKKASKPVYVATRNFCINQEKMDDIKLARELKCSICGTNGTKSLRIATQCNLGDEGVHADLQQYYSHVTGFERQGCRTAMHVGCARWEAKKFKHVAGNKRIRMVYFYPGPFAGDNNADEEFPDPVAACFCRVHAKIIQEKRANEKSG